MSKWRAETTTLGRYAGAGALNTVVGFAVIFLLTWWGIAPVVANVAGYGVGLAMGFVVSKLWVFRSRGRPRVELLRYLLAFAIAFLGNLAVLRTALHMSDMHVLVAQLAAAVVYTVLMYALSRLFVFGGRTK